MKHHLKQNIAWPLMAVFIIITCGVAQGQPRKLDQKIDSLFSHYNTHTPGVSVAVVKNGEVIFKKGYGMANLETGTPITTRTIFNIASVSKQFTAFAIYLLERQGKLSLEDDIRKYIPELPVYSKPIKIKHLLSHTSGIRDQWALLALAGWQMDDVITTEQIMKLMIDQKELNFETGTAFGYSNTGYTLLALLTERITGQSLAHFAHENIFEPLGMTDTQFYDDYRRVVTNAALSYEKQQGEYVQVRLNCSNAGPSNVLTTVEDLARWADNFQHPKVGDASLIAEFNKVSLLDNNKPVIWSAQPGDTTYHAKGQLHWQYNGMNVLSHGGHTAAFRAGLARFPEIGLSVIALSNDEHYEIFKMQMTIVDLHRQEETSEVPTVASPAAQTKVQSMNDGRSLNDLAGEYYSEELKTGYVVRIHDGQVILTHNRLSDMELTRISENKFSGRNSFAFEIEFVRSKKGVTEFLISNFGAKKVKFIRRGR